MAQNHKIQMSFVERGEFPLVTNGEKNCSISNKKQKIIVEHNAIFGIIVQNNLTGLLENYLKLFSNTKIMSYCCQIM